MNRKLLELVVDAFGLTALAMLLGGLYLVHPGWTLAACGLLLGLGVLWLAKRIGGGPWAS